MVQKNTTFVKVINKIKHITMEKVTQERDTIKENLYKEKQLGAAIMLAIDVKAAFELYAYRCITAEQFNDRVDDLIEQRTVQLQEALKKLTNAGDNDK